VRVGLIGAGRIGRIHAETLSQLPPVDEVLIFDTDRGRAQAVARDVDAQWSDNLSAVFARVDGVIIASSTDTHVPLLRQAVEAKVPTFCEKPIALDAADSRAIVDVIQEAGIPVQMGFQRRLDVGYRRVRDMVREGELGTIYLVRHVSHDHDAPPEQYVSVSGGIFKDNLIHDFDILRFVTGQEVETVFAVGSVLVEEYFGRHDDVDTAAVLLRLSGDTLALMSAVRHDPVGYDVRIEAFGSKDTVAAGWSDRTPVASVDGGAAPPRDPFRTWTERFGDAYRREIEAFIEMVRSGRGDVAATVEDAHQALRVAVACGISRAENRPVELAEVAA
jgi:myo-inositol 2-dehydrogenase/D-chiro-inositol 1-dehydrogenase